MASASGVYGSIGIFIVLDPTIILISKFLLIGNGKNMINILLNSIVKIFNYLGRYFG